MYADKRILTGQWNTQQWNIELIMEFCQYNEILYSQQNIIPTIDYSTTEHSIYNGIVYVQQILTTNTGVYYLCN